LGSLEGVAAEKSELVRRSRADAPVVLPNSVYHYPEFAAYAERALVLALKGEQVSHKPKRVIRYHVDLVTSGQSRLLLSDGSKDEVFQIASPSEGICVNAALAIVAAREFGISDVEIRERLASWEPSATRGRIATRGEQTFYIDCYNANPASMRDAIAAFSRSMPVEQARCYVLGAMNELGADGVRLHREIGQQLSLRSEDRAVFVGPDALTQSYYEGAIEAGCDLAQLTRSNDVEKIKSVVAEFTGALFLKGSRSYALETLLPVERL